MLLAKVRAKYEVVTAGHAVKAGLSPVLYHFTSFDRAASILQQNKFSLATLLGSDADRINDVNKGKMYYLSTSRQKAGGYWKEVVFVLDGVKLGHRFAGSAFDYWGPEWRKAAEQRGHDAQHYDENEDRLLTDKPSIADAASYIDSVHVLASGFKVGEHPHITADIRTIMKLSKQKDIPVYVYEDVKAYRLQDVRRAIPFERLRGGLKKTERDPPWQRGKRRNPFARWLKIYHARKKSDLKWTESNFHYSQDAAVGLKADLQNYKADKETRKYLEEFLALWKKEGVKTAEEFIELLRNKYKSIPD